MKRIILLIISFLLVTIMLVGCKSSANNKSETLPLTKENIQKVFADQYTVEVEAIDAPTATDKGSIQATFVTRKNVNKKDSPKLIVEIRKELHENFALNNRNIIQLNNYNNKRLGRVESDNDKVVIGEVPCININTPISMEYPKYSMSTKFNLLNPVEGAKITADDDEDGDITNKIKLKNGEVLTKLGKQTLIYEVTDSDGNTRTNELDIEVTK